MSFIYREKNTCSNRTKNTQYPIWSRRIQNKEKKNFISTITKNSISTLMKCKEGYLRRISRSALVTNGAKYGLIILACHG